MTPEQKSEIQEQIVLAEKRLKTATNDLAREAHQEHINALTLQLENAPDTLSPKEEVQAIIDDHSAKLAKAKKNPSKEPYLVHDQTGKVLKTKGEVLIEGLEKSVEDHKALLETLDTDASVSTSNPKPKRKGIFS